jgi:hypothetical protein
MERTLRKLDATSSEPSKMSAKVQNVQNGHYNPRIVKTSLGSQNMLTGNNNFETVENELWSPKHEKYTH